jgi:transcriptional regulator with XRE-family HTH domain
MAKKADAPEPNHLKAWREFRQLTQEQLASRLDPPTTGSVISLLEAGERKLSPKWLRRLAPALHTTAGYLLEYDPNELPTAILDVWADIPEERRDQALKVLETFRKAG